MSKSNIVEQVVICVITGLVMQYMQNPSPRRPRPARQEPLRVVSKEA